MKMVSGVALALAVVTGTSAWAVAPRNRYTREMMAKTIETLRADSMCEGLDVQIKKSLQDAEAQLNLTPGTIGDQVADPDGKSIMKSCHETLDLLAYLDRAVSGSLVRYGVSLQIGAELNLGKNWLPSLRIFGPNIGISGSKGILTMTGDRVDTRLVSTLGFVPISIGKGKTLPIEPTVYAIGFWARGGVPSFADLAGDYVRIGSDFPNPLSSAMKLRTNTDFEIMMNTHSPVYAFIVPMVFSYKFSGVESRGSDLHAGVTRLFISNTTKEGQRPDANEEYYPTLRQDFNELENNPDAVGLAHWLKSYLPWGSSNK